MPISMDPAAHYTTQQSVWGVCYTGRLTNRRITAYQKKGYFSDGKPLSQMVRRKSRKELMAELYKEL